ncbi:DUF4190 domain-containing protein [Microlunatus flavus]|uniref:DUF4190 domain-containing protein n=1 Tax=Microlunatus flavus TaxID=1036181 RepID=A0A1H9I2M2_9ACTN|nr:DUF4190 domain-containing protein [Microlunatus flavus]SEQ68685.1 hypothetical protein SAMN05421756_10548 [Microlunatus flavus]
MTNLEPAFQPTTTPAPYGPGQPTNQENAMSYPPAPYATDPYAPAPYAPAPYAPAPSAVDPGRTLGIVGLVLSFVAAAVGLVVSLVALRRSRRAGHRNGFALAGVVVGGVVTLLWVVGLAVGGAALGGVAAKCAELGPGTHQVGGTTYTCG